MMKVMAFSHLEYPYFEKGKSFPTRSFPNCVPHYLPSSSPSHYFPSSPPHYSQSNDDDFNQASSSSSSSNPSNSGDRPAKNGNKINLKKPLLLNWNLSNLFSRDPGTQAKLIALMDVYNAAVHELQSPESLAYTGKLSSDLEPLRMFVRKYGCDIGHDGRFTVFNPESDTITAENEPNHKKKREELHNNEGASMQANVVYSMDDPLRYIRDYLTCHPKGSSSNTNPDSNNKDKSNNAYKDEIVIFVPGSHTLHESKTKTQLNSSTERVKYYSQVLEGIPMAQIHAGSYHDQKDVNILLSPDTLNALKSFQLLVEESNHPIITSHHHNVQSKSDNDDDANDNDGIYCRLRTKDLDLIRVVLSSDSRVPFHLPERNREKGDNERLKKNIVHLIDIAAKSHMNNNNNRHSSDQSHLVLMTYSATCNIIAAAISEWKDQAIYGFDPQIYHDVSDTRDTFPMTKKEVEALLRKTLTVVTIGGLCKRYTDGPAYIHISMLDDKLALSLGVSKKDAEGGGKDAVYLNGLSPYLSVPDPKHKNDIYSNDAHNLDACAIQYLSLIRRINGITSFRQMYDYANEQDIELDIKGSLFALNYRNKIGGLEMPPQLDGDLLPSMIRATGGQRWLWNSRFQLGIDGVDGSDSPLPSLCDAEADLTQQFGYGVYDEIVEACGE